MKVLLKIRHFTLLILTMVAMSTFSTTTYADGYETLGPPSIPIAAGNALYADGIGLAVSQPGNINITVPAEATILQVLLYWSGTPDSDDTIVAEGINITGIPISSFNGNQGKAFRADITDLGLVSNGVNTISVGGLDFGGFAHGAGIIVIVDDGSGSSIEIRDGFDYAFFLNPPPFDTTVPQTFTFAASTLERTASLTLFATEVKGSGSSGNREIFRPTALEITVGGVTTVRDNLLNSNDGEEWDTVVLNDVVIPAGATELTVQLLSADNGAPIPEGTQLGRPASFYWLTAGLQVPPPAFAKLGDRVWEDLNNNGVQDCVDGGADDSNFPADGVIGNAGDSGPECDAGIPDVKVTLGTPDGQGNCIDSGSMTTTDPSGFYGFGNLDPADYCVVVDKSTLPTDLCKTDDGIDLGDPQFTTQNAGGNAVDSDVNPDGVSDPVSLGSGDTNLTLDAGVVCPAKIGDRVWSDDNKDGIQDNGEQGVKNVKVTLFECGADMVAGTDDDVDTGEMRFTGPDGMYMFGGEPGFSLDPGKYFVQFTKPDGTQFTTPNVNGDAVNSDCTPPNGITVCTPLGSGEYNRDRDCGLIPPPPPECGIGLDKKCRVEKPPVSADLECEAKIAATVLQYTGSGTPSMITVAGKDKKSQVESSFDSATGILTVDARPGDLGSKMTITTDGVAEVIHTSCSVPYVAGLPAPLDKPKGPSANWLVLSFVDKEGGSVSLPGDGGNGMFADSCTIKPSPLNCDTAGKPKDGGSLTFKYSGGSCGDSNNSQKDAKCTGSINTSEEVTVSVSDGAVAQPSLVKPGEEFTVTGISKSNTIFTLSNSGGTQTNEIHTSCSQELNGGDVYGGLTLTGINGKTGGAAVTYQYKVTNTGDPLTGITLVDDLLGDITTDPFGLGTGDSKTFEKTTVLSGTTVNTATAKAELGGQVCSASDKVTVTVPEPPVGCSKCEGKVTQMTLKYRGSQDAVIRVVQKKDGDVVFENTVVAGDEFTFTGTDKKGTLGTEISIFVNGNLNTKIHTSCSQPVGPGLISGDFEVTEAYSREGGLICPIN